MSVSERAPTRSDLQSFRSTPFVTHDSWNIAKKNKKKTQSLFIAKAHTLCHSENSSVTTCPLFSDLFFFVGGGDLRPNRAE